MPTAASFKVQLSTVSGLMQLVPLLIFSRVQLSCGPQTLPTCPLHSMRAERTCCRWGPHADPCIMQTPCHWGLWRFAWPLLCCLQPGPACDVGGCMRWHRACWHQSAGLHSGARISHPGFSHHHELSLVMLSHVPLRIISKIAAGCQELVFQLLWEHRWVAHCGLVRTRMLLAP